MHTVPQLNYVFEEAGAEMTEIEQFTSAIERQLCDCLRTGAIPSDELVEAIAVCAPSLP